MPDFIVGKVTVRPAHSLLCTSRTERRIEPKVMDVLCRLAQEPGEVVARPTLIEEIWQVEHGADESLTRAISLLRKTFLELDPNALYIRTVPRRGYSLVAEVAPAGEDGATVSEPAFPDRRLSVLQYALGIAAIAVLAGLMALLVIRREPVTDPAPTTPSVAVLPFQAFGSDADLAYFAEGIGEEVLNIVSHADALKVAGGTSSLPRSDGMITRAEIGEYLGVDHLLEGSVRSNGEELRISAQLTEISDNRQIWSTTYRTDRSALESPRLQRNIAMRIAGALSIALGFQDQNTLPGTDTDSLEAYEAYLRGREYQTWLGADRYAAMNSFQRAVDLDPNYASAVTELASITGDLAWEAASAQEARSLQEDGRALAQRALALNPDLAMAHTMLGVYQAAAGEWDASAESFEQALSLSQDPRILMNYALMLARTGTLREARIRAEAALDLEPGHPGRASTYAIIMTDLGLYADARRTLDEVRSETGDLPISAALDWILAMHGEIAAEDVRRLTEAYVAAAPETALLLNRILDVLDEPEAALAILSEAASAQRMDFPAQREVMATLAAWYGDDALALELWRDELAGTNLRMLRLWGPRFAGMRKLPGFTQLVSDLGLPAYWEDNGWPDACRPSGDSFRCK